MTGALWFLLRTSARGRLRRLGRRMRTFRGFVVTALGLLFAGLVVAGQVAGLAYDTAAPVPHDAAVQGYAAVLTFLIALTVVSSQAPFFWPHEAQFLFPAPLSRRALLLYLLASRGAAQLLMGLWFGLMTMRMAPRPAAALLAAPLAMVMSMSAGLLASVVRAGVASRFSARERSRVQIGGWIALLGAAGGLWLWVDGVGIRGAAAAANRSGFFRVLFLPARPFAEIFAAETTAGALAWAAAGLALIVATVWTAVSIPADFRERSLVASARALRRWRRSTGRGTVEGDEGAPARKVRRSRLPSLAFLGGAAPLARRHLVALAREPRMLVGVTVTAAMSLFYCIFLGGGGGEDEAPLLGGTLVALVVVFPLLASIGFTADFRRDVDRIAYLRSLPLPPLAMAVGETVAAVGVLAFVDLVVLAVGVLLVNGRVQPGLALASALLAAPVSWLAVMVENWLFLLFPTRLEPGGGNAMAGRAALKLLFKGLVMGFVGALAGLAGWGGWLAGGVAAAAACVGVIVLLACGGATWLVGNAFRGFDLAVDSPA